MHKLARKVLRTVVDYDPDYYDMYADAEEAWFARLYLAHIRRHAAEASIQPPASLLEAGCQAGRLAIPLAQLGFQVTGVDTSGYAIRRAREHARAAGVEATFIRGNLLHVLQAHPQRLYDLVVCAEVVYLSPDYRAILAALAGALRPGGLLCVSHRPKWYYLLEAMRQKDLDAAIEVLRRDHGPIRDSAYYNWQTAEELRPLYESLGLRWLALYPIDRLAWLTRTALRQLTATQRAQWLELELALSHEAETCARYVLVIAQAPPALHTAS